MVSKWYVLSKYYQSTFLGTTIILINFDIKTTCPSGIKVVLKEQL